MAEQVLIVTEKHAAPESQRDGGARLVETLRRNFGKSASILQLGSKASDGDGEEYPHWHPDRFVRRLLNASWISERVARASVDRTHLVFVHTSMLFGLDPTRVGGAKICLFPMFLGTAYRLSGENVPEEYIESERVAVAAAHRIITPSHLERRMLVDDYGADPTRIKVIPRGVVINPADGRARDLDGPVRLCSVGSIKNQKNPVGLLDAFGDIVRTLPEATLTLVGATQDELALQRLTSEIRVRELVDRVRLHGYVTPTGLAEVLRDQHVHISASRCETFGRSVFETLALGIPNLIPEENHAANDFLSGKPYRRTYGASIPAGKALGALLEGYRERSREALEIGELFCDERLGRLVKACVLDRPKLLVTDFDGTLFHKTSSEWTKSSVRHVAGFDKVVVCSARPVDDLRSALCSIGVRADWLIGLSGSETEDWSGGRRFSHPLGEGELMDILATNPGAQPVCSAGKVHQVRLSSEPLPSIGHRVEKFGEHWYLGSRSRSKLRAIVDLLGHMNWDGQVQAQGDSPPDFEFLSYFDGELVSSPRAHPHLRQNPFES